MDNKTTKKRTVLPENEYFEVLGYKHSDRDAFSTYYHQCKSTGRVFSLCPAEQDVRHLLQLAPLSWFESVFPGSNGPNWLAVVDAIYGACEAAGRYQGGM